MKLATLLTSLICLLYGFQAVRVTAADTANPKREQDLLTLDNGVVKIGINRAMGASITWLSWADYPNNMINSVDPGRLIQQSYYAGNRLDRQADGQHKAWSPWTWNPIQGGGVGSWARVTEFKRLDDQSLYGETIPKLWDMPDEEAQAVMRQWTGFERGLSNVIVVKCEIECDRELNDRWGPTKLSHQEIPACYFTRNFSSFKSYLGNGQWRAEGQAPGPPWGKTEPPLKAMACFDIHHKDNPQGIAIFSPTSTGTWNFGPHGKGDSDDPAAGPCVHVAPLDRIPLGPKSTFRYRYWLVVGNQAEIEESLDKLITKYMAERSELVSR